MNCAFNLAMGIIAGYYSRIRIKYKNILAIQIDRLIKIISLFTDLIMLLICISTVMLALLEKTIGLELQGMFDLGFEITKSMG
jgi:hypothetical protein